MKIISTSPYITEILESLGVLDSVVATSSEEHLCKLDSSVLRFESSDLDKVINQKKPDLVFIDYVDEKIPFQLEENLTQKYSDLAGSQLKVFSFNPRTFQGVCDAFDGLGKAVGKKDEGHKFSGMLQAEFKNWSDNFYDRMKNKKVVVLSSVEPLYAAGLWIPDLVGLCGASCTTMLQVAGKEHNEIVWEHLLAYRPDVILVAPKGYPLDKALGTFKIMEKLPDWESLPAVKRGEVFF
ncbi:MAG: ABC transporter substrate-binding protein, partial [Bdellovibrionales bacterium]|nr:ABC transporter substrate-binding protein [Bdellovibrionales bacterium]